MTELVPWIIEGSFALGIIGFMYKLYCDQTSIAKSLFRRFDEHKEHVDTKMSKEFVSKEMCHLMHNNGLRDFERLEKKVDDGFNRIEKKVDILMTANGH